MTRSGAQRLIENTLKAKDAAQDWREVALILADALAALDFNDIEIDVEPYQSAVEISELLRKDNLKRALKIIKKG